MKKLRNRFYLALLPLQLLLVGLIVWTIFLLNNLEGLVKSTEESQKLLGNAVDQAMVSLHEIKLQVQLMDAPDKEATQAMQRAWDVYEDALETIRESERIQESKAMKTLLLNNERLKVRLESLVDIEWNAIDPAIFPSTIRMVDKTEALIGQVSATAIKDILGLQLQFRERIRLSFYVLGIGIGLGIFGTILISYQIGRIVVSPLEMLQAKLDDVGKGDYDQEVRIVRKDEVGQLAYSLNRMIRNLRLYRNLTDERLHSTTHTFQTVLQRSPHSILFLTQDHSITYANPQADELLSSPEWASGLPGELIDIASKTQKGHSIYIQRQLHEAIQLKINGQPRYYLVVSYPVELLKNIQDINQKNEPGVALTLQDVTKMKLADDIKGNLVATVSHELKTPLTSARMALYLLGEQQIGTLNEDQLDLVDTAKEDLERQLATIQNLLDLSRAESSATDLTKETCRVNEIINESVATHEDLSEACEVSIEVEHAEGDALIHADPHKVTIVLNNFLSNALRHSSHGSKVLIGAHADEYNIRFFVKDFGEGIDEDMIPHIFDRYSQGKESTKVGSAGLGLHIAKQIIEQHGGSIGCESQKGEGSEFYFSLPRHLDD